MQDKQKKKILKSAQKHMIKKNQSEIEIIFLNRFNPLIQLGFMKTIQNNIQTLRNINKLIKRDSLFDLNEFKNSHVKLYLNEIAFLINNNDKKSLEKFFHTILYSLSIRNARIKKLTDLLLGEFNVKIINVSTDDKCQIFQFQVECLFDQKDTGLQNNAIYPIFQKESNSIKNMQLLDFGAQFIEEGNSYQDLFDEFRL